MLPSLKIIPLAIAVSILALSTQTTFAKTAKNQKPPASQSAAAVLPPTTAPSANAQVAADTASTSTNALIQIIGSLGKPNFEIKTDVEYSGQLSSEKSSSSSATQTGEKKISPSSKGSLDVLDFEGTISLPFKKDISLPLDSGKSSAENAKFVPTLTMATASVVIHLSSVKTGTSQDPNLKSNISFTRNGQAAPLTIKVDAPEIDFISLQIRSIDFETKGLLGTETSTITLTGTCGLKQSLIDEKTDATIFKETQCVFNGTYDRNTKKYKLHLHYDSMDK